jgi:hypothetical protein
METLSTIVKKVKTWTKEHPSQFIFVLGFIFGFIIKMILF